MSQQYKKIIQEIILDEKIFVKATFTGGLQHWIKVIIRPVVIKGKKQVQFSYFTKKQDITKNYKGKDIIKKLHEILHMKFKEITVQTTDKTIKIEVPHKGNVIMYERKVK